MLSGGVGAALCLQAQEKTTLPMTRRQYKDRRNPDRQ